MKLTAIIIAAFTLAITTLHAADPVVVVTSATSVTVDGVDYGKPADAVANNKAIAPLIQVALEKYAARIEAEKAEAIVDLGALKGRIDATLRGLLEAELKTGEGPRTALLRKLIAEAGKSDAEIKLEAAKAAEAAAIKARQEAEAALK